MRSLSLRLYVCAYGYIVAVCKLVRFVKVLLA